MDKLMAYRQAVKQALGSIAELADRAPQAGAETLCVFDESNDRYVLLNTGWSGKHRLRGNTLFVRILDGKIWIEEDWTEEGIAGELVKAGIPRDDIVQGFQHPQMRPFTEFAVA